MKLLNFLSSNKNTQRHDKQFVPEDNVYIEYEKNNSCKLILIDSSSTSNSTIFSKSSKNLSLEDAERFIDILNEIPDKINIHIVLNTYGGSLTAAEVICKALIKHKGEITVFIPYKAMSSGLIIALAADKIYLGRNAFVGPIDPQVGYFSAQSILTYTKKFNKGRENNGSWVSDLALLGRSGCEAAVNRVEKLIGKICTKHNYSDHEKNKLINTLLIDNLNHDQALMYEDLDCIKQLSDGIDDENTILFLEIINLFKHLDYSVIDPSEEWKELNKNKDKPDNVYSWHKK